MNSRKTYQHLYTRKGVDEMEFTEAESNLNDHCCEYIEWGCPYDFCEGENGESEEDEEDME